MPHQEIPLDPACFEKARQVWSRTASMVVTYASEHADGLRSIFDPLETDETGLDDKYTREIHAMVPADLANAVQLIGYFRTVSRNNEWRYMAFSEYREVFLLVKAMRKFCYANHNRGRGHSRVSGFMFMGIRTVDALARSIESLRLCRSVMLSFPLWSIDQRRYKRDRTIDQPSLGVQKHLLGKIIDDVLPLIDARAVVLRKELFPLDDPSQASVTPTWYGESRVRFSLQMRVNGTTMVLNPLAYVFPVAANVFEQGPRTEIGPWELQLDSPSLRVPGFGKRTKAKLDRLGYACETVFDLACIRPWFAPSLRSSLTGLVDTPNAVVAVVTRCRHFALQTSRHHKRRLFQNVKLMLLGHAAMTGATRAFHQKRRHAKGGGLAVLDKDSLDHILGMVVNYARTLPEC
jgi:hypothetical protein